LLQLVGGLLASSSFLFLLPPPSCFLGRETTQMGNGKREGLDVVLVLRGGSAIDMWGPKHGKLGQLTTCMC
jgi:hypothetical protein